MPINNLWVDTRGENDTAALLIAHDLPIVRELHEFGDVGWEALGFLYGVELKSSTDLFHSVWNRETGNRLSDQLDGLRNSVNFPILGIHGIWLANNGIDLVDRLEKTHDGEAIYGRIVGHSRILSSQIDAYLWRISHPADGLPITVIHRPTKDMLIDAIVSIFKNSLKEVHGTFTEFSGTRPTRNPYMNILLAIEGLGPKKAGLLLDKFKTPMNTFNRSKEELVQIEGIGLDTVNNIIKTIGRINEEDN